MINIVVVALFLLIGGVVWSRQRARAAPPRSEGRPALVTPGELVRSLDGRRSRGQRGLSDIQDPREAAALLMAMMAAGPGGATARQITCMVQEAMTFFGFSEAGARALIDHAVWVCEGVSDPHRAVSQMTDLVQRAPALGAKEIVDLDGMLVAVSEAETSPDERQLQLLALFRRQAGLRV